MDASDRLWRDAQTCVIGFIHNWEQARSYETNYSKTTTTIQRNPGFTEQFGTTGKQTTHVATVGAVDNEGESKEEDCWIREEEFVTASLLPASLLASTNKFSPQQQTPPLLLLTFYQYRPCWGEQLACRVAGIPHVVVNQKYAVSEVTGPLPMLLDLVPPTSSSSSSSSYGGEPVVIGRRENRRRRAASKTAKTNNSASYSCQNDILHYLQTRRGVDLFLDDVGGNNTPHERRRHQAQAQSRLLQSLITGTLSHCLTVLRYKDHQAWEQVNRRQCLQASAGCCFDTNSSNNHNHNKRPSSSWRLGLSGLWQTRSERLHALSRLPVDVSSTWSVEHAIQQARSAYQVLEVQLQQTAATSQEDESYCLLLHPTQVTLVDVLLWDHLANALADVHLVTVLAEFPALCRFAEHIWETYFSIDCSSGSNIGTTTEQWKLWNAAENARNPFCHIPFLPPRSQAKDLNDSDDGHKPTNPFHDAVELMETLSVTSLNLQERLALGAKMRHDEQQQAQQYKTSSSASLVQRHQHDLKSVNQTTDPGSSMDAVNKKKQEAAAKRAYQYADQVWLATVLVATVAGIAAGITGATRKG